MKSADCEPRAAKADLREFTAASRDHDRWEIWDPINEKTVIVFFNTGAFTPKSRVEAN
jgi:hypothetical protein